MWPLMLLPFGFLVSLLTFWYLFHMASLGTYSYRIKWKRAAAKLAFKGFRLQMGMQPERSGYVVGAGGDCRLFWMN